MNTNVNETLKLELIYCNQIETNNRCINVSALLMFKKAENYHK